MKKITRIISKNPDAVAWLYIPGAEVDDPVMQA